MVRRERGRLKVFNQRKILNFICLGALLDAIQRDFGSLEQFKTQFAAQSVAVQGSGWGWLGYNAGTKRLEIATTANQDPLLHLTPILGVDVWEVWLDSIPGKDYLKLTLFSSSSSMHTICNTRMFAQIT